MKLRIKEMIFNGVHIFNPQIMHSSIKEGHTINAKYEADDHDPNWSSLIGHSYLSFQDAENFCNKIEEISLERKIIIHELPER